jgi:hypothetical protein
VLGWRGSTARSSRAPTSAEHSTASSSRLKVEFPTFRLSPSGCCTVTQRFLSVYAVFDVLALEGSSTMRLSYSRRRELLESLASRGSGLSRPLMTSESGYLRPFVSRASKVWSPNRVARVRAGQARLDQGKEPCVLAVRGRPRQVTDCRSRFLPRATGLGVPAQHARSRGYPWPLPWAATHALTGADHAPQTSLRARARARSTHSEARRLLKRACSRGLTPAGVPPAALRAHTGLQSAPCLRTDL